MEICQVFYRDSNGVIQQRSGSHDRESGATIFDFPEGEWKLSKVVIGNEIVVNNELDAHQQVIVDRLREAFVKGLWPMYQKDGQVWMQAWFPFEDQKSRLDSIGISAHWFDVDHTIVEAGRIGALEMNFTNTIWGHPSVLIRF